MGGGGRGKASFLFPPVNPLSIPFSIPSRIENPPGDPLGSWVPPRDCAELRRVLPLLCPRPSFLMNTSLLCSASCSLDEARPKGLAHRTGMGGCWRLRTMVLWHSADCPLSCQPSQELCIFCPNVSFCPNVWLKNRTVPSLWPSFLSPFTFYSFISSPSRLSVLFFSASPFFLPQGIL